MIFFHWVRLITDDIYKKEYLYTKSICIYYDKIEDTKEFYYLYNHDIMVASLDKEYNTIDGLNDTL